MPQLSLILPLRASARQAENALTSLLGPYQTAPHAAVEILVVEADSDDPLGEARARAFGETVRYFRLDGTRSARTRALAVGVRESRAPFVGLFMDGAHVVTPRAIETALRALVLSDRPLVALPDYRFDETTVPGAGSVSDELAWLEGFPWKTDPNELFNVARFGPANPNGFLGPLLGAACLFANKESFTALPAPDERLDVPGAAAQKLWLYTELARPRGTRLVVLAGEGAFRQHHAECDDATVKREEENVQTLVMSAALPLSNFVAVHREPTVFGTIPGPAQRFVATSAEVAAYHCAACAARGEPSWYEDR